MYKNKEFPEEDEIIVCTVKKILYDSIFVDLDQYMHDGLIHISEIAPGRIRNIRDYVRDGKKIVCKVLRVDKNKNNIELSLRRVSQAQRINKNKEYKQELKSEKLLDLAAKKLKISLDDLYKKAGSQIVDSFGSLTDCFNRIVSDSYNIEKLGIEKKIAESITSIVKEKVKLQEVTISGIFSLESRASNGIEIIKKTLSYISSLAKNCKIKITYLGAPKYKISITSNNYKTAENIMKEISESTIKYIKKLNGEGSFTRNK
ncbi:translation initiation factor IF-2 subunit alpha [Candidatus Woesearchaeota archaeon]|nr:translation initiation factor IF-2 subunit alpha [Candidatus Woesearchaeota archaeon]